MSRGELVMSGTPREIFSRREDLMAIGLGVPKGAELCHRLRQAGYDLPEGLYTLPEVRDAILALYRRGGNGAEKEASAPAEAACEPSAAADAGTPAAGKGANADA
jgi:hypothetical protein